MSTTPGDAQIQGRLDRAVAILEEIRSDRRTDRLFDVLDIMRDEVNGLSREHDSIRGDVREVMNLLIQLQTVGSD